MQLSLLQDALSEFGKFEAELKVKSSHLANLRVDISNPTASLSMLKGDTLSPSPLHLIRYLPLTDKSAGGRVSSEFNEASQKLQDYCECLGIEVNERINILDMLKECKVFTAYRLTELQKTAAVSFNGYCMHACMLGGVRVLTCMYCGPFRIIRI